MAERFSFHEQKDFRGVPYSVETVNVSLGSESVSDYTAEKSYEACEELRGIYGQEEVLPERLGEVVGTMGRSNVSIAIISQQAGILEFAKFISGRFDDGRLALGFVKYCAIEERQPVKELVITPGTACRVEVTQAVPDFNEAPIRGSTRADGKRFVAFSFSFSKPLLIWREVFHGHIAEEID